MYCPAWDAISRMGSPGFARVVMVDKTVATCSGEDGVDDNNDDDDDEVGVEGEGVEAGMDWNWTWMVPERPLSCGSVPCCSSFSTSVLIFFHLGL